MEFTEVNGNNTRSLLLQCGSMLVLAGAARYDWQHGIRARRSDKIGERSIARDRRVSLTFRTVIL